VPSDRARLPTLPVLEGFGIEIVGHLPVSATRNVMTQV